MDSSMLGSLYTLLIASAMAGLSLQHAAMWDFMFLLERRAYIALKDSIPDGPSRMKVLVCSLRTVCFREMHHILVCGHCHPFRTAALDTTILTRTLQS